jgi:hypothetical protein
VVALAGLIVPVARADEWDKKTYLTFSAPVEVPGATLPAGTYTFKLADLQSNRHVVQILNKDESQIYATLLAIPDQRLEPSDKPVVLFSETPSGTAPAVKAWFYPGDTIGDEFVYPRNQAMKIAKATHQPVLSSSSESSERSAMKTEEVGRVDENGQPVNDKNARSGEQSKGAVGTTGQTNPPPATTTPQPAASASKPATTTEPPATTSEPKTAPPATRSNAATGTMAQNQSQAQANAQPRNGKLPKTASPLALYELISGLAFAGAYGVRRFRAR